MNNYFARKRKKKKKETLKSSVRKGQKTASLLLVVAVLFGSVAYVWLINDASTQGFVLHSLETKVQELENENQSLELEARRLQALSQVEDRMQELLLVEVTDVEYLTRGPSQVAINN